MAMQGVPPTPEGKELVTQNLTLLHIHRRNGQRLDRRSVKVGDVNWVMVIGQARCGFIDIVLAEHAAYWPEGAQADEFCGPRGKTKRSR